MIMIITIIMNTVVVIVTLIVIVIVIVEQSREKPVGLLNIDIYREFSEACLLCSCWVRNLALLQHLSCG